MFQKPIPRFCIECIERLQAQCEHAHTSFKGGWGFSGGDVWDDIEEYCNDCGVNLDKLPHKADPLPENETVIF